MRIEPRPVLIDEVYARLKAAILSGDLAPGLPLAQEQLADRLGVSRQPVSHALRLLHSEGLVTERGRRGLMVAPVEPDRLRGLYQVRAALDGLAARLAAERAAAGAAADLTHCLAEGRRALGQGSLPKGSLAKGSLAELIDADAAFHQAVYDLSGNPAIAETAEAAWPHFRRSMGVVLSDASYRERAWREHAAIAEAIRRGAAAAAESLAREHAEAAGLATWRRLSEQAADKTDNEAA